MDATMRATCPTCQASLKIPTAWAGQAVKCKKCGAVVRTKPRDDAPAFQFNSAPLDLPDDEAAETGLTSPAPANPYTYPTQPAQSLPLDGQPTGSAAFAGLEGPAPAPRVNPFEDEHTPSAPPTPHDPATFAPPPGYYAPQGYAPPPGYPYPMPPGYAPPPGYGPPPGYTPPAGYAPPPGYPYPAPPGYPPAGYPYAPMPGYGPPPGYPPYPYPAPGSTPHEPQTAPPGQPAAPQGFQPPAPIPAQPPAPAYAPPHVQPPAAAFIPPPARRPAPPLTAAAPHAVPDSVGLSTEFKTPALPPGRSRRLNRQSNPAMTAVWVGVCLLLTSGLVIAGILGANHFKKKAATVNNEKEEKSGSGVGPISRIGGSSGSSGGTGQVHGAIYPRRLLFIHVSHYMYLNPLTYSERVGFDRTRAAADRLAYEWHVPNDSKDKNSQLYYLSDTSQTNPILPLKPVITGAFERFFETSRAQDRIIMYYGGHAVERGDKAYLVPAEGDLEDVSTLIPVEEIYAKLAACPATQKVVIWDVCRFNPERGRSRPGSEPMTEKLSAALAAAPPGVQVVLTCQPGENALEFYTLLPDGGAKRSENVIGSSFLEAVRYGGEKNKLPSKDASPNDPFPIEEWVQVVDDRLGRVNSVAKGQFAEGDKLKQSVKLVGSLPETQVSFNPAEAPASRFEFPEAEKGANSAEVAEMFDDIQVPPIDAEAGKETDKGDNIRGDLIVPFRSELLADYKNDVEKSEILKPENREKYLFRVTVIEAFTTINELWGGGTGNSPQLRREFKGMATDSVKKEIEKEQEFPAKAGAKLDLLLTRLEAQEANRATQPKRWQANYDYAVAQVKSRLAFIEEYNARLGNIRTDVLPELDPKKGQDGYRLVSSEVLKSKRAKEFAEDAQERFDKIIVDYKGTPWAIQARRDKAFALGLVWQPFSSGAMVPEAK